MQPEIVTLLVAIFSALGLIVGKIVEQWASRNKTDADVAKALRDGLYQEITRLQAETKDLRARCDILEGQVTAERERNTAEHDARVAAEALNGELARVNDELSVKCTNMQRRITALEEEVRDLRGAAKGRLDEPLQR